MKFEEKLAAFGYQPLDKTYEDVSWNRLKKIIKKYENMDYVYLCKFVSTYGYKKFFFKKLAFNHNHRHSYDEYYKISHLLTIDKNNDKYHFYEITNDKYYHDDKYEWILQYLTVFHRSHVDKIQKKRLKKELYKRESKKFSIKIDG